MAYIGVFSKCRSAAKTVYRNVPSIRNGGQEQNWNSRNGHFPCIFMVRPRTILKSVSGSVGRLGWLVGLNTNSR